MTHLTVRRTIALSNLDASLLYGVPFYLQAHLDGDLDSFRENKMLVHRVFQVLMDHGRALLLEAPTSKQLYVCMV